MHLFFSKAIAAPVLYESRGTDVLGQLVPLRRLSVLIGHGVPSGYSSRVMLKPSRTIRGGTKPRASIYLWSRIVGVYVEPPLHNHNALFPASIAYRMKPFLLRFWSLSFHENLLISFQNLVSQDNFGDTLVALIDSVLHSRSLQVASNINWELGPRNSLGISYNM